MTMPFNAVLNRWNSLDDEAAAREVLPCCGSHAWAAGLAAGRPFADAQRLAEASDRVWAALPEPAWSEAFDSHPRIGQQHARAATAESLAWSSAEQRAAGSQDDAAKLALAEGNRQYAVAEVEAAVAVQAGKKVDIIKLWMDDELGRLPKMPYPIAKAIIDDAHRRHLRVTAHIFYLQDAKQLTDYGVDGLAHSVRDKPGDQALIESMKAHGTWQMAATLSREASMFIYAGLPPFLSDPFFTRGVSPAAIKTLQSPAYRETISSGPHFKEYPAFLATAKKNLKTLVAKGSLRQGWCSRPLPRHVFRRTSQIQPRNAKRSLC